MRNLESTDGIDTPNGTSRRSLFRKALAAAAPVAGAGGLLDLSKRTARVANGDFLTVGNTDQGLPGGPDTSSNTTALDCMESPESWFEDFGSGALAGGRASVAVLAKNLGLLGASQS